MPFVVDDIFIGSVIVPIATRLGQRWLDQIAAGIDGGLRKLLRRVVNATKEPTPNDRERLVQAATEDLAAYLEHDRNAARELLSVTTPSLTSTTDDDVARLEALFDYLNYILHLVAYLRQPVALRGFLTGTEQPVVIDARTHDNSPFKPPMRLWGGVWTEPPRIGMKVDQALLQRVPRIWLPTSPEFDSLLPLPKLPPEDFARTMEVHWQLDSITPNAIRTVRTRFYTASERFALTDDQRRADRAERRRDMVDFSETPEGIIKLRDALIHMVEAESSRRREWGDALRTHRSDT